MHSLGSTQSCQRNSAGTNPYAKLTDNVAQIVESIRPPKAWYIAFFVALLLLALFLVSAAYVLFEGIGVWGNGNPVVWAFDIVNFVFWIGIGHAGTLISALFYLTRQGFRTSINRIAEAMTVFAVICAAVFPGIHLGRPWLIYWMFPSPNQRGLWPQFRSPLEWDLFAVGAYAIVSLLFWYMGMIPDFATIRDRAGVSHRRLIYGLLAMGWRGSSRHWHRYENAYLLIAALVTPLVISVHSIVSFNFAVTQLPGWHSTISPLYFVTGAILSGFAMVVTLAIPARQFFGLKRIILVRHIESLNEIILASALLVTFVGGIETFSAWYGGNVYERYAVVNRALGSQAWSFWLMLVCNVGVPQLLWWRRIRRHLWIGFTISLVVNVGMWFERFVIVVSSLSRDFLPGSFGAFTPTMVDYALLLGSFGLFLTLFLLFCRYLPMVSIAEVKSTLSVGPRS
jgi:molybdopterin-containing oxidoreductase family membrane subunit